MKKLLAPLLLLLLLTIATGCVMAHPPLPVAARAKAAVVDMQLDAGDGTLLRFCTAVAVGPQTIWTARHCVTNMPEFPIFLDGGYCPTNTIVADDGADGVLIHTPCDVWKHPVPVSHAPLSYGDKLFMFGNVYGLPQLYRVGYVMVTMTVPDFVSDQWPEIKDKSVYVYDMNTGPGDSGAAIFNYKGEAVCVHSMGIGLRTFNSGACLIPTFTQEQWGQVR